MIYHYMVVFLTLHIGSFAQNLTRGKNTTGNIQKLIYKGYNVGIHDYSYAVFLQLDVSRPSYCGASLIMVQVVLTAASCLDELRYKKGTITAYFGETIPRYSKVLRKVINYRVHPKYEEVSGKFSIAVAFLDDRVPLMHTIKKIPLAVDEPPANSFAFSVGWGTQDPGVKPRYRTSLHLKATKQKLVERDYCNRYAGFRVSPSNICSGPVVGHNYRDDVGNGLIIKAKISQLLVGVLSYVVNDISVYASVMFNHKWIGDACWEMYYQTCIYDRRTKKRIMKRKRKLIIV